MQDLLLDANKDLLFKNGDLVIANSNNQNQELILTANKGEYKQHPEVGVGIEQMLGDDDFTPMLIEIKKQLEYDGMQIDDVRFTQDGKLFIDGKYKE